MCGIVAILRKDKSLVSQDRITEEMHTCQKMLESLRHRGPDESNTITIGRVCLGHTRLSVIDLTTGSQPIFNEDKSVAVILNGEIYNFQELRRDLEKKGHRFSTCSDTEVIVHLYEEVGEDVFSRLNGMFAIVIYDAKRDLMLAARDRIGEKPLLYWDTDEAIVISSELKAILHHPDFQKSINIKALCMYLHLMYIPAPYTIFEGVKKLLPAHYLSIQDGKSILKQYWEPKVQIDWNLTENKVAEEFTSLFSDSIKKRTISDVPIGVFLSGGIDSSAVAAFMALNSADQIKTFSVGFADEIDERPYARIVASRYKTDHHEVFVNDRVEDVLEKVITHFDEPFGDSSAIPTYLISREARRHVKVILTGDGGDELFAGYDSYIDQKYQYKSRILTRILRAIDSLAVKMLGYNFFDRIYPKNPGALADRHWRWVRTIIPEEQVSGLIRVAGNPGTAFFYNNLWLRLSEKDALTRAYMYDLNFYLPDDLLKKIDMTSMSVSLECRAPFLDYRLIEFSLKIPPQLKVKKNVLKYLLKLALTDYLPHEILERPKIGFGAPVQSWMKHQLKDLIFDYLRIGGRVEQYLDRREIRKSINAFFNGSPKEDFRIAYRLWLILVLEIWLRSYL